MSRVGGGFNVKQCTVKKIQKITPKIVTFGPEGGLKIRGLNVTNQVKMGWTKCYSDI
jgi:hypothetical protein